MALENSPTNSHKGNDEEKADRKERRRKRRWGEAKVVAGTEATSTITATTTTTTTTAVTAPAAGPMSGGGGGDDDKNNRASKLLAMQDSIRARLAAAKAKQAGILVSESLATAFAPPTMASLATTANAAAGAPIHNRPTKRAKHYELDLSVTGPTFTGTIDDKNEPASLQLPVSISSSMVSSSEQKAAPVIQTKVFLNPYLAHMEQEVQPQAATTGATTPAATLPEDVEEVLDARLGRASKPRQRHKAIRFVEPGQWQQIAERKRERAAKAAAAGFVSGRKVGHTIHAAGLADAYYAGGGDLDEGSDDLELPPRADAHWDVKMPLTLEWWDMELLPSALRREVARVESLALSQQSKAALQRLDKSDAADGIHPEFEKKVATGLDDGQAEELRRRCFDYAALSYSKTAALVQHIVPIRPAHADTGPPKESVLYLTKKERKRQRKLRRQEKQRELRDLQAAGLVAAPEPRLTLKNFIQVLGDQAFVDPSQMEQKVIEQIQARQRAHMERNDAMKLTQEQRAAKRARKLDEDTTAGVTVAVFLVRDMSHPYHRSKVELNARQSNITGGVLECANPTLACVICEGGPKAINRFCRLMLVRMKWTGPDDDVAAEEDDLEEGMAGNDTDANNMQRKFNPNNKCELVWQGMAVKRLFNWFVFQSCETSEQARKVLKAKGVAHYWDQVLDLARGKTDSFDLKLTEKDDDEPETDHDSIMHDES